MQKSVTILIILLSNLLLVFGQVLWKIGLNKIGPFSFLDDNVIRKLVIIFTNLYIIIGLLLFGLATLLWFQVLSHVELSTAYPIMSISYILGVLIGILFFNETFAISKIIGLILIVAGVFFLSRSL